MSFRPLTKSDSEMLYERSPEENRLVEGCLQGNRQDQKRLYEKFYGKMLGICLRYATDREMAQDMLQEGFIKIFSNMSSFGFQCPLEAWMRRIMINTSIDALRKQKTFPTSFDIENATEVTSEEDVISEMSHQELLDLLGQLPAGYKVVFNMYVIEGFSHREIAETLGITEGTSKSQLSKAKAYLQKLISRQLASRHD